MRKYSKMIIPILVESSGREKLLGTFKVLMSRVNLTDVSLEYIEMKTLIIQSKYSETS